MKMFNSFNIVGPFCWLVFYTIVAVDSEINITIPTPLYYEALRTKELHFEELRNQVRYNESKNDEQQHWKEHATKLNLNQFLAAIPSYKESLPVNSSNQLCAKHSRFILKKADHLELWALKMLDSSGKLSPSLLQGNVNQLGDFDQCLSIDGHYENENENVEEIFGKYCLVSIDLQLPQSLQTIDKLIHSHYVIRSKLSDPGHRIPKFASMYWALCVPHTCSHDDVKEAVISQLKKLQISGLKKDVSLEDFMCQTKREKKMLTFGTVITALAFIGIIGVVAISTFREFSQVKKNNTSNQSVDTTKRKWWITILDSFSLKRNVKSLFSLKGSADEVTCLHGIRTLNALALLLSHKCMQLLFYPYVNRTQMTEIYMLIVRCCFAYLIAYYLVDSQVISYPYSMLARSAIVYTDSFILISGCLAAQCFLKNFDRKNRRIFNHYLNRFLRLTPNLMAIILFCTFILPVTNSGPFWNVVVSRHADLCKKYWWRNLIYVHNYYGFEEMCLTHTHQLGIDMQLYLFSPILIYLLWRFPFVGVIVSATLATISTYLRYYVTFQNNLSPIIYYGVSVSQLFSTASLSYILPTHRATSYIMGIFLGYYLHYRSTIPVKFSKAQIRIGNFFFSTCGFLALFGTYWMSNKNYKYSASDAAMYMAFSPIVWCSALIWGIIIDVHGYTSYIGDFFKWSGFRIFTRIAYAIYLIQFPVYFYNVGTTKSASYFTTQILFNIEEYTIIFLLSIILTLLFDLPFQNISQALKRENNNQSLSQKKNKIGKTE